MPDHRDHTPVTVTLPAYAVRPVLDALKWRAIRLRTRAKLREEPEDGLDRRLALTLDEAAGAIRDAS